MTSYAEGGDNDTLKAHAAKAQPIIQTYRDRAQQLDQTM
jgi:hypothetical protein